MWCLVKIPADFLLQTNGSVFLKAIGKPGQPLLFDGLRDIVNQLAMRIGLLAH